jgi:hypothetical protein
MNYDSIILQIRDSNGGFREWGVKAIGFPIDNQCIKAFCFCGCQSLCEVLFDPDSKSKEVHNSPQFTPCSKFNSQREISFLRT